MGVTFYMSGKVKRLQTLPQIMERETRAAIRRGQNRLRKAVGEEFRARGVGQAIFRRGYSKGALKTILARERVKKVGDSYEVGLRIKGIAAIVGRGDRTKAHTIKPSKWSGDSVSTIKAGSGILANKANGFFARGPVAHPGSKFERDDFAGRALGRTRGEFRAEVDKGMSRVAEVVARG